jgi:hypothetical protein
LTRRLCAAALALLTGLLALHCGRYGPPRRARPVIEAPQPQAPQDAQDEESEPKPRGSTP